MSQSMTKMEQSPGTGKKASRLELCAAAKVASTANTALKKETDMMVYIRYEGTMENTIETSC